jgi:ubiquinone/menaquinone biosynthesis C-methylase UbiE
MPIDFHAENNRFTYASRQADSSWVERIGKLVSVRDKQVVDIGCGGGIYSKALAEMGAQQVIGVDMSAEMLKGARENARHYEQIEFIQGTAMETGLLSEQYDLVLERALVHHISAGELPDAFAEAYRLLKVGGTLIVQDRTPEDCLLPGSENHVRGYFFEAYPKLVPKEVQRRHDSETMQAALQQAGFSSVGEHGLWETRRVYESLGELKADLLARTGRSLLHDLTDEELSSLVEHIAGELQKRDGHEIVEQDRWTIWIARKA